MTDKKCDACKWKVEIDLPDLINCDVDYLSYPRNHCCNVYEKSTSNIIHKWDENENNNSR